MPLSNYIGPLKICIDSARKSGIALSVDYSMDHSASELQDKININSRALMFHYGDCFDINQSDFEQGLDVLLDSIDILRGSTVGNHQKDRLEELIVQGLSQDQPLQIPYSCVEYLPGYVDVVFDPEIIKMAV